ncbi:toprim domain-containing protein [Sphingobium sp. H39-3-25]|nr:toprim domain-containing protein [Sphingobium arseniciresistens]
MRAIRRLHLDVPVDKDAIVRPPSPADTINLERALAVWGETRTPQQTLVATYLASRGITHLPAALRYHPRTPLGKKHCVSFRPALIAAVRDDAGITAIQRCFFDRAGPWLATDLRKAKLTLGRPLTGAVRLYRPTRCLGLAEGIETALSAAILLDIPVWATLGNERLARVAIPDFVDQLILLPDNDQGGRLAAKRALDTYARPGRLIRTLWPWRGLNDWNDVLMEELGLRARRRAERIAA